MYVHPKVESLHLKPQFSLESVDVLLLLFFTSVLDCMILGLFSGFSESYKISSYKCCDLLESMISLTVREASVKRRCSLVLEVKLKLQSLTLGITQFLQFVTKINLNFYWISISSVNTIILFQHTKGHADCCSYADKFMV